MRITQEADYALRITYLLARQSEVLDAGSIAKAVGVTESFTLKILRKLSSAGLLRSKKGVNGGYELAVPTNEVSMRRVIETIDGPVEISRCLSGDYVCSRVGSCKNECAFHCIFGKLNVQLAEKLDSVTLDVILSDGFDINNYLEKI